ncbi:TPA: protein licA, partial [Haemophilus influenzae]
MNTKMLCNQSINQSINQIVGFVKTCYKPEEVF